MRKRGLAARGPGFRSCRTPEGLESWATPHTTVHSPTTCRSGSGGLVMPRSFIFLALLSGCLGLLLTGGPESPAAEEKPTTTPVGWQKIVIDKAFRSEGVAVADVNRDGKMDILVGDVWYEGPDFKKVHRIRPGKDDYAEGQKNVYSKSFA